MSSQSSVLSVLGRPLKVYGALTHLPNWSLVKKDPRSFIGQFGICNLPCIALRATPSDAAEMDGQLLFGEVFQILDSDAGCFKVERVFRTPAARNSLCMRGWIDDHFIPPTLISEKETSRLEKTTYGFVRVSSARFVSSDSTKPDFTLPFGSLLPDFVQGATESFSIFESSYTPTTQGSLLALPQPPSQKLLLELLGELEGTQYLWGGQTGWGIDCSGLTQTLMRVFDIEFPRNASEQILMGDVVEHLKDTATGDLVYFKKRTGTKSIHVGFVVRGDNQELMLYHARQRVKLQFLETISAEPYDYILPERPDQEISGIRRLLTFT